MNFYPRQHIFKNFPALQIWNCTICFRFKTQLVYCPVQVLCRRILVHTKQQSNSMFSSSPEGHELWCPGSHWVVDTGAGPLTPLLLSPPPSSSPENLRALRPPPAPAGPWACSAGPRRICSPWRAWSAWWACHAGRQGWAPPPGPPATRVHIKNQCCGSMKFWYGSGSADPYLWLMNPDADPDPAIFVSYLQEVN